MREKYFMPLDQFWGKQQPWRGNCEKAQILNSHIDFSNFQIKVNEYVDVIQNIQNSHIVHFIDLKTVLFC